MALWFYTMIRVLRQECPLKATINQVQFQELKLKEHVRQAVQDIEDPCFFKAMFRVCRAVFLALKALRSCNKSEPNMDKLYFLSNHTTLAL